MKSFSKLPKLSFVTFLSSEGISHSVLYLTKQSALRLLDFADDVVEITFLDSAFRKHHVFSVSSPLRSLFSDDVYLYEYVVGYLVRIDIFSSVSAAVRYCRSHSNSRFVIFRGTSFVKFINS